MQESSQILYDLLIVGAGINGAGLARDAAGRGLKVLLIDQGDIGGATSAASTKLIHGGLRYLERFDFSLVRESLREREILRSIAAHLVHEQRFVIAATPKGRPRWQIRLGLGLYDRLGGRSQLQRAQSLRLSSHPWGEPLRESFRDGFAYSDLAVDDARLTLLNALSAAQLGARVAPRCRLLAARRAASGWQAQIESAQGAQQTVAARILVNAAGPWAAAVRRQVSGQAGPEALRLVKGSHLVLPRLYEGEQAYLLQNDDGRIVFVIPWQRDFSLIGTTEVTLAAPESQPQVDAAEAEYLCALAGRFFRAAPRAERAVWRFAGIRALFEDGRGSDSAVSRESRLIVDGAPGEAPLLSIYGGKLTTYRHLAEQVLERLRPWLTGLRPAWSGQVHLPGAGLGPHGPAGLLLSLARRYPNLPPELLEALARRHGTLTVHVLGAARIPDDLGERFGEDLWAIEVDHFLDHEWARTTEDILWRRTKCGLRLDAGGAQRLADHLASRLAAPRP